MTIEASESAHEIARFARKQLAPILDCSGKILYSSAATLRPGKLYLLGHNPGGDPETHSEQTLRTSLDKLPGKVENNYLDERWTSKKKTYSAGEAPLQKRVGWMLGELGFEVRDVAASNLSFSRSIDVAGSDFELANLCWPVHEQILENVSPEVLIVFGNSGDSPYTFLRDKFGSGPDTTFPSGHGDWKCRAMEIPSRFRLIGLPHLSRYSIIGHDPVIDWITSYLTS